MEKIKKGFLNNYSKREKKKFGFLIALLAFPVIQVAIFYVYVNLSSFYLSFQHDITMKFTWDNYKTVFERFFSGDGYLRIRLLHSMAIWIFSTFVTFPVSICVTFALFKKIPGSFIMRVIYYLPSMIGSVIMIALFKRMVSASGPVVLILKTLNPNLSQEIVRNGLLANYDTAFPTLLFYSFWTGIGSNIIILTGAMIRISPEVYEACKLDGVGFWREFLQITLPLIKPTLITLIVFSMASLFTADVGVFTFFGTANPKEMANIGYELTLVTYLISDGQLTGYGYPAALGMTITIITMPIVLVTRYFLEKSETYDY